MLGVNWDDASPVDVTLDMVGAKIATDAYNNCMITDLYSNETKKFLASEVQTFSNVASHSHIAKKIKCLPW